MSAEDQVHVVRVLRKAKKSRIAREDEIEKKLSASDYALHQLSLLERLRDSNRVTEAEQKALSAVIEAAHRDWRWWEYPLEGG